jgi:NTP pyrophosphatase (non-canonical NTP hydrolase)
MTFEEYQRATRRTAVYPKDIGLLYVTCGLAEEAGEIANKVKKVYKDGDGYVDELTRVKLIDEIGDALCYMSELCNILGIELDNVAERNNDKLEERLRHGTLHGEGDDR